MDAKPLPRDDIAAPAVWGDSLARSAAQIAAGQVVALEPVLDRLRASIARVAAKRDVLVKTPSVINPARA